MRYSLLLLSGWKGKTLFGLAIGGLAWALVLLLYAGNLLESYELKTYDQLCRLKAARSAAPQEVALVVVDQGSLEAARKEGLNWPWPRQMYAPILQFCAAAGARAVAFDILFTEPSSYGVEDDRILEEALRGNGRAFLPLFLSRQDHPRPPWEKDLVDRISLSLEDASGQPPPFFVSALLPLQGLAGSTRGLGNVAVFPDPDGIYRRLPAAFPYQGRWIPSLGLAVFQPLQKGQTLVLGKKSLRLGDLSLPLDRRGNFLLHYYSQEKDFPRFSAFNVIQSSLALQEGRRPIYPPESLRDKIVFVGFTAPGLFDLKPTPVSSVTPGMAVHATFVANLLRGDFRERLSPPWTLALALALSLGMAVTVLLVSGLWQLLLLALAYGAGLVLLVVFSFLGNLWIDGVLPASSLGLSFAMSTAFSYATEGRQKRQIKQAFSHYMSDLLIQDLLKNPEKLRLGGERRVLTVFFSDLAGFTGMSEKLEPEEVVTLLNRYLTAMTDIILASGGIIDKYEGDAIMAFWGAPLPQEDHAARACRAALENQARLAELRKEFIEMGLPPVFARIGLNTGEMIIGNMGSSQRFDFTVIGDSVNLASRLEGAGKQYGVSIIVSEETLRRAPDAGEVRELDLLQVKGKERPVRIFELLAPKGGLDPQKARVCRLFAEGLASYRGQDWEAAISRFQQALDLDPQDGPAGVFLARCRNYQGSPPGPGWDGVFRLTTK